MDSKLWTGHPDTFMFYVATYIFECCALFYAFLWQVVACAAWNG